MLPFCPRSAFVSFILIFLSLNSGCGSVSFPSVPGHPHNSMSQPEHETANLEQIGEIQALRQPQATSTIGIAQAVSPLPRPSVPTPCAFMETCLPPRQPYAGQLGGCNLFILQCSLAFEMQSSHFPSEKAKIAYMIALLSSLALPWTTAVCQHCLAMVHH